MKVLVVAAHPDDEVLGCGGTIARHTDRDDEVSVLIIATGGTDRGDDAVSKLRTMAYRAAVILGTNAPMFCRYPDQSLDSVQLINVTKDIERYAEQVEPEVVYTHSSADLNKDHRIVHEAVVTAFRPPSCEYMYFFETPSSTEWGERAFYPKLIVDITDTLEQKIRALQCYDSEMREVPHPRSYNGVTALARIRGSQNGFDAAEAFEVGRVTWA
jgi:LmbE family N-acetylglucosaminyl deacetylase